MPLYLYECEHCNNQFEELQKFGENEAVCKKCNNKTNKKLVGHSSFILKGFGWAKDGYSTPTTPISKDAEDTKGKSVVRIPEYADKKTGKKLGFGKPEVKKL